MFLLSTASLMLDRMATLQIRRRIHRTSSYSRSLSCSRTRVLPAQLFVAHRISNTPSVREPFDEMITGFANTEEFLFTPPAAFVPHPSILSYKMGSVVKRIGSKQFWRGIHCRDFVEHGLSFCSFRLARKFV